MKILHINCHPDFNNDNHTTNALMNYDLQLTKSIEYAKENLNKFISSYIKSNLK